MTTEPTQFSKFIAQNLSFDKCEKCNIRPRVVNCVTCDRCERVRGRYIHRNRTPEITEVVIIRQVEHLYRDAKIEDLPKPIQAKLEKREHSQDVFFFGPIGTGKTYAMAALIRKYIYSGFECKRINFDDFCVQVRSTMSPVSKLTEWDLIEPLKKVDMLFIDDLGLRSKQETDFAYVTFYSLLNKRQERMLPTFISSNKNIERLAQAFDSRVASRLSTALIIEMSGEDRRKESL